MKKRSIKLLCTTMAVLWLTGGFGFLQEMLPVNDNAIFRFSAHVLRPMDVRVSRAQAQDTQVLLVNAWNPLPDGFFVEELVELYGEKRYFKLARSDIYLAREAFEAANKMFRQANRDGVKGFTITSGYRSEEKQRELYENDRKGMAATPGTSEHQSGLAFDVTTRYERGGFEDTAQFRWLSEHCWDFGFILRYPQGKEDITGIPYEPWHYRFVGVSIAQEIHENGWTLEEYCQKDGA